MFETILAAFIGLFVLVAFGVWANRLVKKHQKPIGEILVNMALKENESIFVLMMILACVAESISAATVFANDPTLIHTNVFARISQHLYIGIVGILASMVVFREMSSCLEENIGWYRLPRILGFLILALAAIGSPLANLVLSAANVKQEVEFNLWLYSFTANRAEEIALYTRYGKTEMWSPWAALQPAIKVQSFVSIFHLVIAFLEGLRTVSSKERMESTFFPVKKKEEKKDEKKDESKDENKKDPLLEENQQTASTLETLLVRIGYKKEDKATTNIIKAALSNITKKDMAANVQAQLAVKASMLKNSIGTVDSTRYADDEAKKKAKTDLENSIRELLSSKPPDGFGVDVKKN